PQGNPAKEVSAASQEEGDLGEVSVEQDLEALRIEIEYYTPSQTEGPFYPVQMPDDRDNDLFVVDGAGGRPAGEILVFEGTLYDGAGIPVPGAVVEIWQTDDNGIYMHPGDSNSSRRDVNFQSYGESETGPDGRYSFRTIMPGDYNPRPRHIHVKVRMDGRELLTTQFYFSRDSNAGSDRIFAGAGEEVSALIMEIEEGLDSEGNSVLTGRRDIVLRDILSE
ncbi:MAG: protocatechuate 3,4-dioxygenase, partial [Caldilineaceae bacterium]|nr:protocatechuate 3,4-dioxygenase [Caldilineaceae bacterium]